MIDSIFYSLTQLQDKTLQLGVTVVKVVKWKLVYWLLYSQTELFTSWWIIYFFCCCPQIFSWILTWRFLRCSQTCSCCRICTPEQRSCLEAVYSRLFWDGIEIFLTNGRCSFGCFKYSISPLSCALFSSSESSFPWIVLMPSRRVWAWALTQRGRQWPSRRETFALIFLVSWKSYKLHNKAVITWINSNICCN